MNRDKDSAPVLGTLSSASTNSPNGVTMTKTMIAVILWCFADAVTAQPAANFTPTPRDQTLQATGAGGPQKAGCECHENMIVLTPPEGTAQIGQPFALRFDASRMCFGQTIRDSKGHALAHGQPGANMGTVTWEAGSIESLPDVFGQVSHTFQSGGDYTATISIDGQCYDTGGSCRESDHYKKCAQTGKSKIKVR
jgi:hypothetical protein